MTVALILLVTFGPPLIATLWGFWRDRGSADPGSSPATMLADTYYGLTNPEDREWLKRVTDLAGMGDEFDAALGCDSRKSGTLRGEMVAWGDSALVVEHERTKAALAKKNRENAEMKRRLNETRGLWPSRDAGFSQVTIDDTTTIYTLQGKAGWRVTA